ncbi:hypothetical protein PHYPSEUDO_002047 [Phytophthora pseudosyringae]|uniref:RxLR effector protein n=1 Tax=Phytophthora pseudosyringae TaxID=221518 RepID=A0A8T1VUE2_9STRA|nr:hypothetical protein PHYPSEUDO_002047 [Phytophthora pseudosyringae]
MSASSHSRLADRIDWTSSSLLKSMRWYRVLFATAVSFRTCSDALSVTDLVKISTVVSTVTLLSANPTVAESSGRRLLRAGKTANVDNYSFKDVDHDDNGDDKTEGDNVTTNERVGGTGGIEKLNSLKISKWSVPKAVNSFSEKILPALPTKAKLQLWSNHGKSVNFVRKELGLDELAGAAFTQAKNFQYYDDFVTSQLPIWAKKELTPDKVEAQLGLQGLSGAALTRDPDFKYYDEFVTKQALVWSKQDLSVDAVLVRLGLNTLTGAARTNAANYKYYDEFVIRQLRSWMAQDVPVTDVMAKLKLDKLTGDAFLSHSNYVYYKSFVKSKLRTWATDGESLDDVALKLGLEDLRGKTLETHPNYKFLVKYWEKREQYLEEGWLKQGVTTFDIWKKYEVGRVHPSVLKGSYTYEFYKRYVTLIDDYIIGLHGRGFKFYELPRLTSKAATPEELHEKTLIWTTAKRPEWYVKFSLGLDGLGENALKEAPNYQFYEYYQRAVKYINRTREKGPQRNSALASINNGIIESVARVIAGDTGCWTSAGEELTRGSKRSRAGYGAKRALLCMRDARGGVYGEGEEAGGVEGSMAYVLTAGLSSVLGIAIGKGKPECALGL